MPEIQEQTDNNELNQQSNQENVNPDIQKPDENVISDLQDNKDSQENQNIKPDETVKSDIFDENSLGVPQDDNEDNRQDSENDLPNSSEDEVVSDDDEEEEEPLSGSEDISDEEEESPSMVISDLNAVLAALKSVNRIIYDKLAKTGDTAVKLFSALGYDVTDELYLACYLANYGLLAIPESILLKQGYLSENEFREIKKHPQISAEVAKDVYLNALGNLYNEDNAEIINQNIDFITNLILDHHELPPANPIAKGYFNKMSVSREAYILGIADKIVGATDKTRRLYSIIVPVSSAAREILSVFGETDAIFTANEKQIIWDILVNNANL
jgi:HD-GYP domain-containing protein (c-di-GMP phosphodiesterase class II)